MTTFKIPKSWRSLYTDYDGFCPMHILMLVYLVH